MKKRLLYFDLLKVLSSFAVVLIHVISEYWYDLPLKSSSFFSLTMIDGLIRFAVPIYLMISGAIFLNEEKEITIKDILTKYALKIILLFIFWNTAYVLLTKLIILEEPLTFKLFLDSLVSTLLGKGVYHLSFLVLIIGFYLSVPLIRKITKKENKKEIEYLLILLLIFTSILPMIRSIFGIKVNYSIMFSGFLIYVILGYYLNTFPISKNKRIVIYVLGIVGYLITSLGTYFYSNYVNNHNELFYTYLSLNVIMLSSAIFVFFKNLKIKNEKTKKVITFLGKEYFGVYLVHGFVIGLFHVLGLFDLDINMTLNVIILSILVFLVSLLISFIMSKIPYIKKLVKA